MTTKDQQVGNLTTFRPDIKVIDCTIRDGGLMNNHNFSHDFVKTVYQACVAAGIDYMEFGYKNTKSEFPKSKYGPWKHCDEEDLRKVVGENKTSLKICVMADAEKSDYKTDIIPKKQSVIDMIRVATYIHQIPTAIDMIEDAHAKGYETTCNIMAISKISEQETMDAVLAVAQSHVGSIYVVDSFGALYPEQVRDYTLKYLEIAKKHKKTIGIHAHNNQALAFANTIESLIFGASFGDSSMAGLGRGAGNCRTELLLGFLRNPKYNLRPVIEAISTTVEPLRKSLKWGFAIPYMLTGQLNDHPRAAMKLMENDENPDYLKFYDEMTESGY